MGGRESPPIGAHLRLHSKISFTVMSYYTDLENMRSNDGNLYRTVPVVNDTAVYFFEDHRYCCNACANNENGSLAEVDHDEPQWNIIGYAPRHYLGPERILCSHCGAVI